MLLGVLLLFMTLFATLALLLLLVSGSRSKEQQQALNRLESIAAGPQFAIADAESLLVRREDVVSGIKWLDRLLQEADITRRLRLLLYQAAVNWTPVGLLLTSALIALACGYLTFLRIHGLLLSFFLAVIAGSLPLVWVLRKREKRFFRIKEHLPEVVDLMVSAIRAGHSFSSAMGLASRECPEPVKSEFRQCYDEQNYGLDLRVAMTNLANRAPLREIRMISTAVLVQKETGGNLTEILERASMLIRDDFRLQRQIRVHTAQGRLTGWILTLLPPILGIGLYFVNPEQMSLLWTTAVGVRMLEVSVIMTVIGGLIIRKIIRIEV